jgi:fatty acid desaturase
MITIHGVTYDISEFKHPGGNAIDSFKGKDGTDMFLAMHAPHSRAKKMLASLPIISTATPTPSPFQELHAQVMERIVDSGIYDVLVRWWLLEQVSIMVVLALGWVGLLAYSPSLSCLVFSVCMLHTGWLAHHVMHQHFGPYWPILIELSSGYSQSWWHLKHNIQHHSHTNVSGKDTDIDIDMFSFEKGRPCIANQHIYFWPLLMVTRLLWCFRGVSDRSWIGVHHAVVFGILCNAMPWSSAVAWYLSGSLLSGFMLGFVVVQSHNAETIVHDQGTDHLAHTALTTRNLPQGPINTFMTGYLNYQIEHHLFPWLPCVFFADIQPLVKKSLAKQNLPYTQMTWTESMTKLYCYMRDINSED